ncbi:hypothetical protein Cyast_0850 [Cyanobacterium stanieri PCC 7202]|uniref:Uncharacterized protein n=1 Tax=Cyanobacterium stanieri (strain ATCC 29140 / PCC 7202) TaxID=292563 RepID=K9YK22_CYASC|nr:hypothetical protein Cyast_0850 [Cyanobacterium stanieri PCC 7202]
MSKQEDNLQRENQSLNSWVEKKSWLALYLYSCIYGTIGWSVASRSNVLSQGVRRFINNWNLLIDDSLLTVMVRVLSLLLIMGASLAVINPLSIITFIFEESINSDLKAFVAILFWSILLVVIFCYFGYFADILVVTSSSILLHFDLQEKKIDGFKNIALMVFIASVTFGLGIFIFDYLH